VLYTKPLPVGKHDEEPCPTCSGTGYLLPLPVRATEMVSLADAATLAREGRQETPGDMLRLVTSVEWHETESETQVQCWVTQGRHERERRSWRDSLRAECESLGVTFVEER
jgi:hypothetical protein